MSDLGEARGRIVISTEDLRRATQEVQQASRTMEQSFRAVGISIGAAQLGRFVVESDRLATSYARQSVAARSLAGSQSQVNELLRVYDQATGGAIDRATQLANVTQLLGVGFADSAQELDQFARAIRGISVATGRSQEFVTQNLILELFSQRGQRLDQLALQYDLVRQRADELRAADRSLTQSMAYQQAVLEQALERFGALTTSVEGQATGVERLGKAWTDFQLQFGQDASGGVNIIFNQWAADIERARAELELFANLLEQVERAGRQFQFNLGLRDLSPDSEDFIARSRSTPFVDDSQSGIGRRGSAPRFDQDQTAAIVEWAREVDAIERQANRDRLEATRQYEQQRSDTIRRYEQTIAREAQDFAISRARAEEDYAIGLQRFRRDIAQREARQLEDLERTIGEARADAAERAAERQADHEERLADFRADSAARAAEQREALQERIDKARVESTKRIAGLEEEQLRERERAQRDHARSLISAAAQLDAFAIAQEQRRFAEEQKERQEAGREAIEDERERLNERVAEQQESARDAAAKEAAALEKRIADAEKAYAKQTASEQRALDKRIEQANEAYVRQLEDARAADEQRLTDMAADFRLRQGRENEDRALRLQRLREDHEAQLAEQVRQHELRLIQIAEQEQEERTLLDDEFQKELDALSIRTEAYREKVKEYEDAAIKAFDAWWAHVNAAMVAPSPGSVNSLIGPPSLFPTPTTPIAPNNITNSSRSIVISQQIIAAPGQSPYDVGAEVRNQMELLLKELEGYRQ